MQPTISISFGIPQHGWLPVDFRFGDFVIEFSASYILNDPIRELYDVILDLRDGKQEQVVWWLEPATYFFCFEKTAHNYELTILEADDFNGNEKRPLKVITGTYADIILPFIKPITQFCSLGHEKKHWPYSLGKEELQLLENISINLN